MTAPLPRLIAETLEQRILHSADLAPLALAGGEAASWLAAPLTTSAEPAQGAGIEIAFVDSALPDADTLLADLYRAYETLSDTMKGVVGGLRDS